MSLRGALGCVLWLVGGLTGLPGEDVWVQVTAERQGSTVALNLSSSLPAQSSYETTVPNTIANAFQVMKRRPAGVMFGLLGGLSALEVQFTSPQCVQPTVCVGTDYSFISQATNNWISLNCLWTNFDGRIISRHPSLGHLLPKPHFVHPELLATAPSRPPNHRLPGHRPDLSGGLSLLSLPLRDPSQRLQLHRLLPPGHPPHQRQPNHRL